MPTQFRIKNTRNAYLIGNYLDLGPFSIVVPQVEDEETVDEAIDAFYYPQSEKGVGVPVQGTASNRIWNDWNTPNGGTTTASSLYNWSRSMP